MVTVLYLGELVSTQRIIDSGVVAVLRYAIEVRKEAKLSSDATLMELANL